MSSTSTTCSCRIARLPSSAPNARRSDHGDAWRAAKLVRSKNAGPFWLTIDIMFDDAETYRRARDAEIVNRAAIARLYNRNPADIIVVNHDTALAIKVSFPRPKAPAPSTTATLWRPAIRAAAGAGGAKLRL